MEPSIVVSGELPPDRPVTEHRDDAHECSSQVSQQEKEISYAFSKEMINFSLYGKSDPKSNRSQSEPLNTRLMEVQDTFKNIPPMFYFAPSTVNFDTVGVYTSEHLPKGTVLGPYFGKPVPKEQVESQSHNEWMWEVYQDNSLACFVDATDPKYGNWMTFIQCARFHREQNLKAVQSYDGYLYFEAIRDITGREELLVWYDEVQYDLYMGIPVGYRGLPPNGTAGPSNSQAGPVGEQRQIPMGSGTETMPVVVGGVGGGGCTPSVLSHLSEANSDDSGISLSLEHSGGFQAGTQTATSLNDPNSQDCARLRDVAYPPAIPVSPFQEGYPPQFTEQHQAQQGPFQEMPHHQWPQSGGIQARQAQGGVDPWPLKSVSKTRAANLIYGMFSRSEDGTRWQCEECKRMFSSQGSLRAHARIHTGERPYQCQYCYRNFCQASTLRSHERLHTGEKPYKCEHCGRSFTQSAGLRSHMKTHRYDS